METNPLYLKLYQKIQWIIKSNQNDKYHDRLNKIFVDKLKDIKDNLTYNEKNKVKEFYNIFKTYKHGPLATNMPEEQNFMYQFIKNKLEPFVSPISNTPQAPPQSKEQPSNEGSAPQQAPQHQAPEAPHHQPAPDAPQHTSSR